MATFTAPYAQPPISPIKGKVTTAATIQSATNAVLLFTAGASGAVITRLAFNPTESPAAVGVAWVYTSADGSAMFLLEAQSIANATVGANNAPSKASFSPSETLPWRLGANEQLWGGYSLSKTGTFTGEAMNY